MQPPTSHQNGRINLTNLKSKIAKQLGPDRTQMYFSCLSRLLAHKLSKTEFSKLCLLVLGRENMPLHNKLIRSILRNAYHAKTPPPLGDKNVLKQSGAFVKKSLVGNDPLSPLLVTPHPLIQCDGHILPPSPGKRTNIHDRKSSLGSNGRVEVYAQQSFPPSDGASMNSNLGLCDWKRPVHNHHSGPAERPVKIPCTENSLPSNHIPLHSKGMAEMVAREDGEKKEESIELNSKRPLQAPLGIPSCPPRAGGARKLLSSASCSTCGSSKYDAGELRHTEDLRKCMEKVAGQQGMGVTLDCANLLNNSLDVYLKRLIKSTVDLARARPTKHPVLKQQVHEKPMNDIWPGNHMHVQSSVESVSVNYAHSSHCMLSFRDFLVAMELNPQQLGEDWPLLFEKICIRSSEA